MCSAGSPASIAKEFTTRLVEVPTRVVIPPRIEAYDRGISSFEGGWRRCFEIGPSSAPTTAVLFMKAEIRVAKPPSFSIARPSLPLSSEEDRRSSSGERSSASDTSSSRISVASAGLVKLDRKACWLDSPSRW